MIPGSHSASGRHVTTNMVVRAPFEIFRLENKIHSEQETIWFGWFSYFRTNQNETRNAKWTLRTKVLFHLWWLLRPSLCALCFPTSHTK